MGRNSRLLEQLGAIATRQGFTETQLALAWVLGHPASPFVIPGTRRIDRICANAAAAEIKLSIDVRAELEKLFGMDAVSGARHNDRMLARTDL
jgi:aryl-alcohol dehydrogenase-like predicted oxidoreductase